MHAYIYVKEVETYSSGSSGKKKWIDDTFKESKCSLERSGLFMPARLSELMDQNGTIAAVGHPWVVDGWMTQL